jgi:transposase InsO family protein
VHSRAKPAWVRQELLQLAACDPHTSCRNLTGVFNRRHASNNMTVGRTLVSNLLRNQHYEVMRLHRNLRRRRYLPGRRNQVWGINGTGKTDTSGTTHFLLGILDHGTRRCLSLRALRDKASITLLRALLDAVERYGAPKAIRTDNEVVFQSRLFRLGLKIMGIGHQTIELHCPWQNGRIERFFGTLKSKLNHWAISDRQTLNASLHSFMCWYNHVRPHQHLQGRTRRGMEWGGCLPATTQAAIMV